jgi:hypothetical protein
VLYWLVGCECRFIFNKYGLNLYLCIILVFYDLNKEEHDTSELCNRKKKVFYIIEEKWKKCEFEIEHGATPVY